MRFLKVMPRLPVTDLRSAIAFYRDLLGFSIGPLWPERDPTGYVVIFSEPTSEPPTCHDESSTHD